MKPAPVRGVLVLHKALDVLEAVREPCSGLPLAELARKVRLPKPTVYRIVATLETRGYLDRNESGGYRLSRKLIEAPPSEPFEELLRSAARPAMRRLVDACRETVNLGVLEAQEVVVIETIESPQAVRMSSKVGNRRHLHSTALGKILLAGMDDKEILRLVRRKGLPRMTEHTLTSEESLLAELRRVRQQGCAVDDREHELEGRCIGAAIRGARGETVAALSISGPAHRMTRSHMRRLLGPLQKSCEEISAHLARRS